MAPFVYNATVQHNARNVRNAMDVMQLTHIVDATNDRFFLSLRFGMRLLRLNLSSLRLFVAFAAYVVCVVRCVGRKLRFRHCITNLFHDTFGIKGKSF